MSPCSSQRGSALITVLVVGLMLTTGVIWYSSYLRQNFEADVHRTAAQQAYNAADEGVYAAINWLRTPIATTQLPPGGTVSPAVLSSSTLEGSYHVSLSRSLINTSLVDVYATGYYFLQKGNFVSPEGPKSQRAAVHAIVNVQNTGNYFAAVPTALEIFGGANIAGGDVYAPDLTLHSGGAINLRTAYYLTKITIDPGATIIYSGPFTTPQRLPTDPNLLFPDPSMRTAYNDLVAPDAHLPANYRMQGAWPPAAPTNTNSVFVCDGDLHIGRPGQPVTMLGSYIVYVTGTVYIHSDIRPNSGAAPPTEWLGIVAEGSVMIASDAPSPLTINATIVTAAQFGSESAPGDPRAVLNFTGGFTAKDGVNLANNWSSRVYQYLRPNGPMALPSVAYIDSYQVTQGAKFR